MTRNEFNILMGLSSDRRRAEFVAALLPRRTRRVADTAGGASIVAEAPVRRRRGRKPKDKGVA